MTSLSKHLALFISLTATLSFPALSQDSVDSGWMGGKSEGWFWYQDPVDLKPAKPVAPKQEKPAQAPEQSPDAMSVKWLRENLPKFLERAIDNPTQENVAAYLSVQRVILDKSQRFEEAALEANMTHPWLDESNRVPPSTYGNMTFREMAEGAKDKAFAHLVRIGGLFVFIDSTCQYCRAQASPVIQLAKNSNMDLRFITADGKGFPELGDSKLVKDNGIIKKLGIKIFPTTVYVAPPNSYLIISQGIMSQEEMKDRIVFAAVKQHLLPANIEVQINPYIKSVLDTKDTQHGATQDPKKLNEYVQQKIESGASQ